MRQQPRVRTREHACDIRGASGFQPNWALLILANGARTADASMATASSTDTLRYPFHKPRGALALLCASASKNKDTGEWEGEPGQLQALADIREQCIERGFTVIKELGTSGEKPTADDIRKFVRELSEHDFSKNDALMMVIGSHGHEGGIWAWPNLGEDEKSGPVALRDEIFSLFQPPLLGTGTKASQTLVGKPKVFLIDACRSPKGDGKSVEHPLRPARGVFDGLGEGQYYTPPIAPDGAPVTRYSDFCFGFATVPFNEAGLTQGPLTSHNRSLFLSAFAEQLRDHPHSAFEHQFGAANREMQRRNGAAGKVKVHCFPQCAELVSNTLLKALYFDAPLIENPAESGDRHIMDVLNAAQRTSQDDPEGAVAALRRKIMRDVENLKELQQKAKRQKVLTRGVEDESSAFDTSALMANVMKIAQLVGGPNALTGPAGEEVQAACARLGEQVDGTVWTALLVPVRRELDALAQLQFEMPPRLTLLAPAEGQQQLSRGAVRREIAFDDDDDEAPAAQPAQSSAARKWTSVPVGEKLHLQMDCQQNGYCYLFHLNQEDELSVVFPNKYDDLNEVSAANHSLQVPGRFADGGKQYLAFKGSHLEKETFYLLTISKRLEDFKPVGALSKRLEKLPPQQAQAVLATLRRAAGGAAPCGTTFRSLDSDLFAELDSEEDASVSMALCKMTLISVGSAE